MNSSEVSRCGQRYLDGLDVSKYVNICPEILKGTSGQLWACLDTP